MSSITFKKVLAISFKSYRLILKELKYAKSHEWVKVEGDIATIGITDYAQHSLGSIVYVEGGEVGDTVEQFGEFGAVESVKAASDIMSPVSGEILEVNEEVIDNPELINEDPYANWIIKVKVNDLAELDELLSAEEYEGECK